MLRAFKFSRFFCKELCQMSTAQSAPFSALQSEIKREQSPLRAAITGAYRRNETEAVEWLLAQGAAPSP